jgi:hypothetical protein
MSAANYSTTETYPLSLNKRESKVVETATSVAAAAAEAARSSFIKATTADATTDFGDLAVGDLVIHILAADGTVVALETATAGTNPHGNAVIDDYYVVLQPKA